MEYANNILFCSAFVQ